MGILDSVRYKVVCKTLRMGVYSELVILQLVYQKNS
jgi:hypothetical protein